MYLYETYDVLSENNIIQTDIPNYCKSIIHL